MPDSSVPCALLKLNCFIIQQIPQLLEVQILYFDNDWFGNCVFFSVKFILIESIIFPAWFHEVIHTEDGIVII